MPGPGDRRAVLRLGRIGDNVGRLNRRGGLQVGASGVGRIGHNSMQVGASRLGRIGDNCRRGRDIWGSVRRGGWDGGQVEPEVDVVDSEASSCLTKSFCVVK